MLGGITNFLTGGASSVLGQVKGIITATTGDKTQVEGDSAAQQQSVQSEVSVEFASPEKKTFFGGLADFLNRLPRPLITIGTIGLMAWAPYNPVQFSATMMALGLVPAWLSAIVFQELIFYFGDKITQVWSGSFKGPSSADVKDTLSTISDLKQTALANTQAMDELKASHAALVAQLASPVPIEAPAAFKAEVADTATPMSNEAILEWNRQRQVGK